MRFSTIVLSTLLAALSVYAQNATSTSSPAVSGTAPLTPAQSSEAACLVACPANDNTCRTKCVPLGSQTNGIADCITNCPKGDGTATGNANYQSCVNSCISQAGVSATAAGSAAAGSGTAAPSASAGVTGASGGSTSGASGGVATSTGSSATPSKSSAADSVRMGAASIVGAAGLFAALFAL